MTTSRVLAVTLLLLTPAATLRADRIILRNLDIISDKTVESFDEDGVRLNDGTVISWDRIEKGRVAESKQAAFDAMLADLGSDLYRIRQRMSIGDYRGLLPHAESVYARYAGRRSDTAYMVFQALMWARLAVGQREAALEPYLECVECLRRAEAENRTALLPGTRRLDVDLKTGLSSELPPVWFDAEAARQHLDGVGQTISQMVKPRPPATRVYYATLALAAGEREKATQALEGLEELPELKAIVEAQLQLDGGSAGDAINSLARQTDRLQGSLKTLALYWLGRGRIAQSDQATRNRGLLDLLRIAALSGQDQPELAAAGLYTAMGALAEAGDIKGSIAIRRELLDRYASTWHARRVREQD